jgi:acyl-CoA reductase-like NAD-dependent aldehyde dehydrogenase
LSLLGAILAGNCVVLKPNDENKSILKLIAELIPKYFNSNLIAVVSGVEEADLLKQKYIKFIYLNWLTICII